MAFIIDKVDFDTIGHLHQFQLQQHILWQLDQIELHLLQNLYLPMPPQFVV